MFNYYNMELYIFDFDDTLFTTDAHVYVIEPIENQTRNPKTLKNAIPISFYIHYLKFLSRRKKNIAILTCRSVHPIFIQRCIKKHTNIKIPLNNIICVNHELTYKKIKKRVLEYDMRFRPSNNRKKIGLQYFIKKGYKEIYYYDDDIDNIKVCDQINY